MVEHLVGHEGRVTATDLQTEFLSQLRAPNITVQRHDVRTDPTPDGGPSTSSTCARS